ncbi:pilus assembly protein PilM [uncultured Haemophilus sp.]|uniref:pilus assembly protein PilM n=1 Tax=uncultured Haemophilus sp. TaxID=237779 RepID=UPI002805F54F|nr:pilus assembly protein PilM [uncultured Haemophilus sp.]
MRSAVKAKQSSPIGVHADTQQLYFVWFENDRICSRAQPKDSPLSADLTALLNTKQRHRRVVCAVPPQLVWSKSLILPQSLDADECEQQSRFILQKSLPVALDELWFDYRANSLPQGCRLEITAIRQHLALDFLQQFSPCQPNILDTQVNSLLRAFTYLLQQSVQNRLLVYIHGQQSLMLCERAQQCQIRQGGTDLQALYRDFQQYFKEPCEQIYVYSDIERKLPADWQRVDCVCSPIALGNALWPKFEQGE